MSWVGGGGGVGFGGGGSSHQSSASAGLPFAGMPSEFLTRINEMLADEPEHPEPEVVFSQSDYDRRPLSLSRFMAPFKWALLGSFLLVVVETIAMRIGPTLTQLAIDKGMGLKDLGTGEVHGSKEYLMGICAVYIGFVVLAVVVARARTIWTGKVGQRLLYALRVRVFSHFQRLSLGFFTKEKAGVLMSRMTSDVENLQALFQEGLVQLVVQGLTLLVLGTQLVIFNPQLAAITFFIVIPLMLALTWWFQRASDRGYLAVRDRIADVLADLSESLAGIRLVAAHNRQSHNTVHHTNVVGRYRDSNDYTARVSGIYGPLSESLGNVAILTVLLIGGMMLFDGQMQLGEMVGFMLALTTFFSPIQQLAQLYNTYQQGKSSLTKLAGLLETEPSATEKTTAYDLPPIEGHITLDNVTFGYDPSNPILSNVSLDIKPGETYALVGATGAGKSTIAKLITRFYDPDQGHILIDGHDLRDVTLESLRSQLGIVPQEPFLFVGTFQDNIAFGQPSASDEEVLEVAKIVGLDDLIERLDDGANTIIHERGSSLASGERQLLALARAFLARPRVIVLDEATSSLDLKSEEKIERALDVILEGRTAIIIAHRLATAMRADKIAVIDDGRIAELGSHDELVALGGLYAEMYATWESHSKTE